MTMQDTNNYKNLKKVFTSVGRDNMLYTFFEPASLPVAHETVSRFTASCKRNGVICIIPTFEHCVESGVSLFDASAGLYASLSDAASDNNLNIGVNIGKELERAFFTEPENSDMRTQVLIRKEFFCETGENFNMELHEGTLMSLVAFDKTHNETIDLRGYVKNNTLDFTVPYGNWTVEEYLCSATDSISREPVPMCDILDYDKCMKFLRIFWDRITSGITNGMDSLKVLYMGDIGFGAPNRRNWSAEFNNVFKNRFGIDPAPLYPALYHNIGIKTAHIKSLFMECRALMFRQGLLRALNDFSDKYGLQLICNITEPKLSACSWISGDALADSMCGAGAVCDKAYMYGLNSLKIAASGAICAGKSDVSCELYHDYSYLNERAALREAMNAFARGANLLLTHPLYVHGSKVTGNNSDRIAHIAEQSDFATYSARCQSILRGAEHICDIAMLYPIYSLHSSVFLFESDVNGFEYPETPTTVDYMSTVNELMMYSGHDITMLHPEALDKYCSVDGNSILLDNGVHSERYRILIIPSCSVISLSNLEKIRTFYDAGGKILATGKLPCYAFEYLPEFEKMEIDPFSGKIYGTPYDERVIEIIRYIFGDKANDNKVLTGHCHTKNKNGGEAYFLYSSYTASDGTYTTSGSLLGRAIDSFRIPLNVYLPEMPRVEGRGVFNNTYSEYVSLGLNTKVPAGGMLDYIHCRRKDNEILFVSNTTVKKLNGSVYIRGIMLPEIWDPHTGRTRKTDARYVKYCGAVYTRVALTLQCDKSTFIISKYPEDPAKYEALAVPVTSLPDTTDKS